MHLRRKRKSPLPITVLPWLLGGVAAAAIDFGRRRYRETQIFEPAPEPVSSWNPEDYGIPAHAVDEHWIDTPDGERLYAWYCRAEKPKASGIFCHGNTGNITISADIIPHLLAAGLSILFFDYRGYGRSTGRTTYHGVNADAVTAARFHETIRPRHLPSILYGFSLGGAVAGQLIRRHRFDGLILQSTFTSLTAISRVLYPKLPMHLLAGDLFNTLEVVRTLDVPLLVLHGTEDEVIPCAMAHELFNACPAVKRIECIDGGLHKDIYQRDPDALVRALSQFLADVA